jgi:hypothetical protein
VAKLRFLSLNSCCYKTILILILISFIPGNAYTRESAITTAFSPKQGATELVVKTIGKAKKSIKVAVTHLHQFQLLRRSWRHRSEE